MHFRDRFHCALVILVIYKSIVVLHLDVGYLAEFSKCIRNFALPSLSVETGDPYLSERIWVWVTPLDPFTIVALACVVPVGVLLAATMPVLVTRVATVSSVGTFTVVGATVAAMLSIPTAMALGWTVAGLVAEATRASMLWLLVQPIFAVTSLAILGTMLVIAVPAWAFATLSLIGQVVIARMILILPLISFVRVLQKFSLT